ncbi:efflux RND transporter periplasmic adaptor subunit [Zhouia amylolytica]|uniref:Membrane fusion protein n=1 Tax=Zhouia amylolytica AD3 TaxID=1286632 RepID=W2UNK7_9FLAO|nr:HlyD family efflux transporter periplasmic adaptor subunit [Zhouia amylolytica]ETN94917.1 membrane fusion protein [Zhouia amylolytica AD3]
MKHCVYFIIALLLSCSSDNNKISPTRSDIVESVYASVTIQPDSLYNIYSAVGGILDYNYVEEGTIVKAGQPVIQIINNTPLLNTKNAKLAYELAKENLEGSAAILDAIEEEIQTAFLKYKNDSINYFRQKNLWEQQIGSKLEYDTKELNYQLSKNQLSLLKNKFNRTKYELNTQLLQAENNYKTSKINTTDFTVKSKLNGKVYALYKNPGELVSIQESLGTIGCKEKFIIEMLVDEVDIVHIKKGQKTLITLDAYGNQIFEAGIDKIYPTKDNRSQTFLVEALFKNPPDVLYPGLSGEGNIIISQKKNVLTIPKEYLIEQNQVLTKEGKVEVKTGLESLDRVEILEGLSENSILLKPGT